MGPRVCPVLEGQSWSSLDLVETLLKGPNTHMSLLGTQAREARGEVSNVGALLRGQATVANPWQLSILPQSDQGTTRATVPPTTHHSHTPK